MSRETTDSLGHQKQSNYALRTSMTEDEFVKEVTEGLTIPPGYFPFNVKMNKEGYDSLDTVMERGKTALTPDAFEAAANETNALLLDTRDPQVFARGFVPNSINIGIDGNFAPWVGALVPDIQQPILLITDDGREEEVITRQEIGALDKQQKYLVHCAGGYRSMIFLSILRSRGFDHITDVQGGFKAIREDGRWPLTAGEPAL